VTPKTKVILNPHAGRSKSGKVLPAIRSALEAAGLQYDLVTPAVKGEAKQIAMKAAAANYSSVVAAGGDGTVGEVLNGLIAAADDGPTCPLGILPLGTGNDFSDMAGIPRDLVSAAKAIKRGYTRQVDAGWVCYVEGNGSGNDIGLEPGSGSCQELWQGSYFGNSCAVAMEPLVTLYSNQMTRLSGNFRYFAAMIKGFLKLRAWHMAVSWDGGRIEGPIFLLSVANSPRTGGLFTVAPGALMDDGLFDVVLVPEMPKRQALTILPRFFKGTHIHHPKVSIFRTRRLVVKSQPGTPVHADGELITESAQTVVFQILPGKITLLAP
jgi:diacylglycerol kinase (ATP)